MKCSRWLVEMSAIIVNRCFFSLILDIFPRDHLSGIIFSLSPSLFRILLENGHNYCSVLQIQDGPSLCWDDVMPQSTSSWRWWVWWEWGDNVYICPDIPPRWTSIILGFFDAIAYFTQFVRATGSVFLDGRLKALYAKTFILILHSLNQEQSKGCSINNVPLFCLGDVRSWMIVRESFLSLFNHDKAWTLLILKLTYDLPRFCRDFIHHMIMPLK